MIFSSPEFIAFFAVYFAIHLFTPPERRIYLIICGSTVFYAWWKVAYVWLPYLLAAIAYLGLLWIRKSETGSGRSWRLGITIAALFAPLAFFKYSNFVSRDVLGLLTDGRGDIVELPLPLGISFVTFSLTAFVVDIVRGRHTVLPGLRDTLGYVLFFPHVIAGPILRPADLLPQLAKPRADSIRPVAAVAIFTMGLVKKLVFADTIAVMVDASYNATAPTAPLSLLAIYGFAAQIYCDFSGYTDMAIGIAMLIGVRLPENFARPYCAGSAVEFWRRWHMTLSFWLRDYLYIPLGGNRAGPWHELRNVMVTMILGGLWHGASLTFVAWGAVHGIVVSATHVIRRFWGGRFDQGMTRGIAVLLTFHFIALSWVLFRAPSFAAAGAIFGGLTHGGWEQFGTDATSRMFPISLVAFFLLTHGLDDHRLITLATMRVRREVVWTAIAFGWILAVAIGQGSATKFIYFDF